jgi:hypothetical protein
MNTKNQNKIKIRLNELLARKVTRQQFLKFVGIGVVTAIGLGPIMHLLNGKGNSLDYKLPHDYGSGPYGP